MHRANLCRRAIPAKCPCIPRAPGAYPCRGPILDEGSIQRAQGDPSMSRAHPFPEPMHAEDPSLPRAHPSRVSMGVHPCREPISAQGPSILSAHGALSMTRVQPCPGLNHPEVPWGAFHVQGLSMPSDRFPGPIPAKGPSCSGLIHAEDLRRPIHTQYPSMLRAHPSPGTISPKGPCWPIHSEGPYLPRAHPSRGQMGAHPCWGPIFAHR